ncbi:MAG: alpha/beta hydrolase family protein [Gammaproteobacteria bacterium]
MVLACLPAVGACAGMDGESVPGYKPGPGPFTVRTEPAVALEYPLLDKTLQLRIAYPVGVTERQPVIVFSHGGRCSRDRYTQFADHWASHGYVVIQPAHLDSSSLPPPAIRGMRMMNTAVATRRLDMRYIVDSLGTIEALVPGLAGIPDPARIVAAGHSLGGGTAMTVTGLVMVDPSSGEPFGMRDERFDALLLITNPGNSPMMPDDPWRVVAVPTFVATGSDDYSGLRRAITKSDSVFRFPDDVEFAPTPNHYLFIDGMDHYLGGLICKERPNDTPDVDAARIIGGVSVAFLDAYMRGDAAARAFLQARRMPATEPRATLDIR